MNETEKTSYGRPLMKSLAEQAKAMGNTVSFYINENGKYIINDGTSLHRPPTAAAACHFMMGMIASSKIVRS